MSETIATKSGLALQVDKEVGEQDLEIKLHMEGQKPCVLHWGLRRRDQNDWLQPPQATWPTDTKPAGAALQTPLTPDNGHKELHIRLPAQAGYASLEFVLFLPEQHKWDNNNGQNYRIELPRRDSAGAELDQQLQRYTTQKKVLFERVFEVEPDGRLAAALTKEQDRFVLMLWSDIPNLLLHWGISRYSSYEWTLPPESMRPAGTVLCDGHTTQTPFSTQNHLSQLRLEIPEAEAPMGLQFVLKQPETNRWLRYRGGNFFVPIRIDYQQRSGVTAPELAGIANEIVQAEMARNSWTLMHRFNLCHDLLDRVRGNPDGLALLFVWLRYSALRQLTWQRNYNTKPRELSHAEDRLTQKLTQFYSQDTSQRPLLRLMLGCVGPGGEGQRIRDEILQIMHRHHVKEVSGHFLEEWHQKLHNNTTPDDIVICEAYLEFLYSDGNRDRFYQKLQEGGVTRQRLESFERPIRSAPDFVPHLKDGLIHDFQSFLRTLRSVHEGTDLESALNHARSRLDGDTQGLLWRIWEHRHGQTPLPSLLDEITEARRRLQGRLAGGEAARELLYLDLALEQFLRLAVERKVHETFDGNVLVDLITRLLENRLFSGADPELALCLNHWQRLKDQPRFSAEWALHAKSVVDRVARVVGELIDRSYQLLQPKAEMLGHAFHAEAWVITLFSEEVVRGNSLDFVLSMLLRNLEPALRKAAKLGNWQIVSRGHGSGVVEVVNQLREVQGKTFETPHVIVADHVSGDEDIPDGITAVIAPDVTDIVSHVAVRARNAGLLFASCYDANTFNQLKSLRGRQVHVEVTPAGDVLVEEGAGKAAPAKAATRPTRPAALQPKFTAWVLSAAEFKPGLTGGKSLNLTSLAGKLPNWVQRPASLALPFGICERVLAADQNRAVRAEYDKLLKQLETDPAKLLPQLRQALLKLTAPPDLEAAITGTAAGKKAGKAAGNADTSADTLRAALRKDWPAAWECIKRVWASKWNERAYYSRKTQGIPHADLFMAVLLQQVVEADYAFVIHTVSPVSGNRNELYAELVVGLGETLVGNYPGRALSAVCDKKTKNPSLLAYPGKSVALRGSGLIFRSDSNGEDLAGFAGAGLYDSVVMPEPRKSLVDYSSERLVWDEPFRREILARLTELSLAVEAACGSPQDIEGALSKGQYYVVQTRPQVGLHE